MRRPLSLCAAMLLGCASSPYDRAWLSRQIAQRTGHAARSAADATSTASALPPGVSLGDGLTEDEAVATALWNNAAFQAELTQLGFARADLADAGLLPNPTLSVLFPIGPRQIEAWLLWPIEVLWQRPSRVQAAQLDVERVADGLVQSGLDVARDARLAHADVTLATTRRRIRNEGAQAWRMVVELTAARLRAGDVSDAEAASVRVEAGVATELATRSEAEAIAAHARLTLVLGLTNRDRELTPVTPTDEPADPPEPERLVQTALAARPDVRAAELAVEAAGARRGWERARVFNVLARFDGFSPAPANTGATQYTGRAGLQMTLPLFNQNQGGIGRADAEIERATWRYAGVRQQVIAEVTTARAQLVQARASLRPWRDEVLPAAEEAGRGASQSFERGEASYLVVLDATRRLLDVRLREAELQADVRRAVAQLDRSTGGRRAAR